MNVVVVGAGISGLSAAWRLARAGHAVRVLEAAPHPGGRMWTTRIAGLDVDTGAHMLLSSYDRTRALVEEIGLGDRWVELPEDDEGGVLHDGELASFSPKNVADVLRYRGLSFAGRIRVFLTLLESRRWRGELDFFDLSRGDDALDAEDCDSFVRRRLGDEATDSLVDGFIRTFHFHGASKMSAKYFEALSGLLLAGGQFRLCALRGHMRALTEALAARLDVAYGSAVEAVVTRPDGVGVTSASGTLECDAAVVATPAEVARAILPSPTEAQRRVLGGARSSCTILVAYRVPRAVVGDFDGAWVPFRESGLVSGVSDDLCAPREGSADRVLSVWLHEEAATTWMDAPDAALSAAVAAEVERLLPRFSGSLEALSVHRWPLALPIHGVGQVTQVKEFWADGQGQGGIFLCGDYLNHPWVEGAVRCGEKVALRIGGAAIG